MLKPLTSILIKIFATGFYKANAGIFLLLFIITVVPGGDIMNFHKSLMLYFIATPFAMLIVFGVLLIYTLRSLHFVSSMIYEVHQQFLFYSINSYSKFDQMKGWIILQVAVSLPILSYMLVSMAIAVSYHHFLSAFIILAYLAGLLLLSALFYFRQINKLLDGSKPSLILKLTHKLKKPFFTLFVYYVFDTLKLKYSIIKLLSYLIITAVFLLFADVQNDVRVAGIAMLSIAVAHSLLVLEGRQFEDTFLMFTKTLPCHRFKLFLSQLGMYSILLVPELIWLLFSLPFILAICLFGFCLSIIVLFVSLLHLIGLDQEKYMKVVFGLFLAIFIVIIYRLMWFALPINLSVAYLIYWFNYYKFRDNPILEG